MKNTANKRLGFVMLIIFSIIRSGIANPETLAAELNSAKTRLATLKEIESNNLLTQELQKKLDQLLEEESVLKRKLHVESEALRTLQIGKHQKKIATIRTNAIGENLGNLEVRTGKVYEDATIQKVTDVGISVLHSSGTARIAAKDLPVALQERFKFDSERAKDILEKEQDLASEHHSATNVAPPSPSPSPSPANKESAEPSENNNSTQITASNPKGSLMAQIKGYRDGNKDVEFTAHTNCSAKVTVYGAVRYPPSFVYTFQVDAGKPVVQTVRVKNSYSAVLQSTDGKVLDEEMNLRKTGLGKTKLDN